MTEYAYVTRYCLTKRGIVKIRVERRSPGSVMVRDADKPSRLWYVLGIEAFLSKSDAVADAKYRRDARLAYLQAQINRLCRLEFKE